MHNIYQFKNYTIYQPSVEDWEDFKAIRLQALRENPLMLAKPIEAEENRTPDEWRDMITMPNRVHFIVKYGHELVGQCGILIVDEMPETAILVGNYLRKGHRGKGLTVFMGNICAGWAQENGFKKLRAYHREDNYMARNVIVNNGFTKIGEEEMEWADKKIMKQYFYERVLAP